MSEPIVCVDWSEVRPGKLEELKVALRELVAFVGANEPRPVAYRVYLTPEGRRMTVVQVHPDSASMEYHMDVAGPVFARFASLLTLAEMHVYGEPSERLMGQLRRKARMLGNVPVQVHRLHAGFARFEKR